MNTTAANRFLYYPPGSRNACWGCCVCMTWCRQGWHDVAGLEPAGLVEMRRQLNDLQLLVLDVDGVLTDGGLWFDAEGQLIKRFDVRDGLGIRLLQQAGVQIAFSAVAVAAPRRYGPANWVSITVWSASRTNPLPCKPSSSRSGSASLKLCLSATT